MSYICLNASLLLKKGKIYYLRSCTDLDKNISAVLKGHRYSRVQSTRNLEYVVELQLSFKRNDLLCEFLSSRNEKQCTHLCVPPLGDSLNVTTKYYHTLLLHFSKCFGLNSFSDQNDSER